MDRTWQCIVLFTKITETDELRYNFEQQNIENGLMNGF